jgi:hypothetical protein
MSSIDEKEYIYLLQEREFVRLREPTYKVGRTSRGPTERIKEYPTGSIVLLVRNVNDSKLSENLILQSFREKFTQMKTYGREYFSGDHTEMIKLINKLSDLIDNSKIDKRTIKEVFSKFLSNISGKESNRSDLSSKVKPVIPSSKQVIDLTSDSDSEEQMMSTKSVNYDRAIKSTNVVQSTKSSKSTKSTRTVKTEPIEGVNNLPRYKLKSKARIQGSIPRSFANICISDVDVTNDTIFVNDADEMVSKKEVFSVYEEWCKVNNLYCVTYNHFNTTLNAFGIKWKRVGNSYYYLLRRIKE